MFLLKQKYLRVEIFEPGPNKKDKYIVIYIYIYIYIFFFFFATPHSMLDLSSPTRELTCIGSTES